MAGKKAVRRAYTYHIIGPEESVCLEQREQLGGGGQVKELGFLSKCHGKSLDGFKQGQLTV